MTTQKKTLSRAGQPKVAPSETFAVTLHVSGGLWTTAPKTYPKHSPSPRSEESEMCCEWYDTFWLECNVAPLFEHMRFYLQKSLRFENFD